MNQDKPSLDEALEMSSIRQAMAQSDDIVDIYLSHYGVKGMKWGVRKKDELIGRKASGKKEPPKPDPKPLVELTSREKAILKAAGFDSKEARQIEAKYGPGSLGELPPAPESRLTPGQKQALKVAVGAVGVAGAVYLLYKYGEKLDPTYGTPANFKKEWKEYQDKAGAFQNGYSKDRVDSLSTTPFSVPAGGIFKRISTEMESTIRPGGFYASHDDEDVDRYKAILPVFWKMWGLGKEEGYVVKLKAKTDIKAPSQRETYEIFKGMLNDSVDDSGFGMYRGKKMRDLWYTEGMKDDDEIARLLFPQAAANWVREDHPATKAFFKKLQDLGYNAVPDLNDAGALSKNPMRIIDGTLFEIDGHDNLSKDAIRKAQETIQAIKHMVFTTVSKLRSFSNL